jgi:hypothetical protein
MADRETQVSVLAILQYLADDPTSLCSIARAHSRLHQAAVAALHSISTVIKTQQQADSVLFFLQRHSQHVDSIDFNCCSDDKDETVTLRQLPPVLQLSSLQFSCSTLQLQPGHGFQGVLGPSLASPRSSSEATGLPLKQLLQLLKECKLLDGPKGLADTLSLLPGLEHLSIKECLDKSGKHKTLCLLGAFVHWSAATAAAAHVP